MMVYIESADGSSCGLIIHKLGKQFIAFQAFWFTPSANLKVFSRPLSPTTCWLFFHQLLKN